MAKSYRQEVYHHNINIMNKLLRTLIALDLSDTDKAILQLTAQLIEPLGIGNLYVLHVMPDFTAPKQVDAEFHKLFSPNYPVDEKVKDKLSLDVQEALGKIPYLELSVDVVEGKPFERLLHWLEVKQIDLLVLGHKQQRLGSGITGKRTARHTPVNVLYVPEHIENPISNILVPIDFSERSARSLEQALKLAKELGTPPVTALHIIDQPSAIFYDPSWETSAFKQVLQDAARESYQRFITTYKLGEKPINPIFIENEMNSFSKHIRQYALENKSGLIIIGAKGHTALNNLLFGSVTESLLERCKEVPILVVR